MPLHCVAKRVKLGMHLGPTKLDRRMFKFLEKADGFQVEAKIRLNFADSGRPDRTESVYRG